MNKKVLFEKKVRDIVNETIKKYINESPALKINNVDDDPALLTEMARINTKEKNIFPYNDYNVHIWSNDHNPPHFHVMREDWDVIFLIDSGELFKVKNFGKDKKIYKYMIENVKKWLSNPCCMQPKLTNQENALLQWEQLHSYFFFSIFCL